MHHPDSPPPDNILEDPLGELDAALKSHAFGLASYQLRPEVSYPRTDDEKAKVRDEAKAEGHTPEGVAGRAHLVLLKNEGEADILLDQRGYTVSHPNTCLEHSGAGSCGGRWLIVQIEKTTAQQPLLSSTFESLDALLIALSPAYQEAMQEELLRRFEGGVSSRFNYDDEEVVEEPKWIN
ncbi:hypothetical protein A1Q1_01485 [Trichosporon asahii var. asahii CBS 2479]|uniref:GSKIP domain-containing protein n=1 Tax=Trichosporon asahii var. asahii (strain ATCC 90039 / CBS 2479 / JCM 2466 / KCTC 7840 / NBRC 103889/ NCYC 2677 / UAMH 7654) TaxID=1186058 RepID=J4UDX1_TRIAS|nr:hypothetical protein A1Q1_01485 [Trichosporon asahii var. asahii CBS 2479]EJT49390.1 hypothetical protein A1Q1_01485 [Trichosporon asahii var. asahii CBS 2479]